MVQGESELLPKEKDMKTETREEVASASYDRGARYRLIPVSRLSAGSQSVLLYSQLSGASRLFSLQEAQCLMSCTDFATLEEHAENLSRKLGADPLVLCNELAKYAQLGWFVSDSQLISSCIRPGSRKNDHTKITSITIPTRDRPEMVRRVAASFLADRERHGLSYRLVVADGSSQTETVDLVKAYLAQEAENKNGKVHYAGPKEKQQYADLLIAAGLPPETVRFTLFGHPQFTLATGANRNALLLETIGEIVMTVDDDCLATVLTAPECLGDTLRFVSDHQAVEPRYFSDRSSVMDSSILIQESVISAHETMTGRPLGAIIASFPASKVRFDGACSHLLASLTKGAGTIIATYMGVMGDSGMGSPLAFLLDGRRKPVESDTELRTALSSREVTTLAPETTVSHGGPWYTTCVSLDNRSLLPPFSPNMRGQDTVFGQTIAICFPDAYFGHLPRALLHDPPALRSYRARPVFEFSDALKLFLGSTSAWFRGGSPDKTLRQAGTYLVEISSLSQKGFNEELKKQVLKNISAMLAMLEANISTHSQAPAAWKSELGEIESTLRDGMNRELFVPEDVKHRCSEHEAAMLTRELTAGFGKLLCCWPEMIQTARWLHSRGQGLAQPVGRCQE